MYQVDIIEAKEKLLELIEAAMRGEEVAITQDNQPVVKLVGNTRQRIKEVEPYEAGRVQEWFGHHAYLVYEDSSRLTATGIAN
jgi:prevent-host-death family protein